MITLRHVSISLLLLAAMPAAAQTKPTTPLGGEPPTMGVHLPDSSLVSSDGAAGVEVNPAAMGLGRSWSVLYHHAQLRDDGRMIGGGDALLTSFPVPMVESLSVGAGVQWLRPARAMGYDDSAKISLALSWRFKRVLALGFSYHWFIADGASPMDSLGTMDLAMVLRPWEWLGAGVVVRNLNGPDYDGFPIQRTWDMELLARPLRDHRLELGVGLRIGERRGDLDPRFLFSVEPLDGLRVFGQAELLRRDLYRDGDPVADVRFTVGIGLHLEQLGLAFSTVMGRPLPSRGRGPMAGDSVRGAYQGFGATLQLNGARRPPLFNMDKRLIVLNLKEVKGERELLHVLSVLRAAERRDDVAGVMLHIDNAGLGWAAVQELRAVIKRLRKAGKKTLAYLRAPSGMEYYLAAATETVLLDPAGGVRLAGLSFRTLYFKGLLNKLGLKAQFIRIAEFKSAPEAYTRTTASPDALKVRKAIVNDLHDQLVADLGRDRNKTAAQMKKILDDGPYTPPLALAAGLVDKIVDPGKIEREAERRVDARLERASVLRRRPARWQVGPGIAVIMVEGDIVRGKSTTIPLLGRRLVGDQTIVSALNWARGNSSVKAVVLRINSPGGSAMASHHMWQEVMRLRKVKPVIVSMGNLAASGGYYVACAGHRIYAEPATFTGSIGIFTGKFDASGLLDKIGVTVDSLTRGKRADMESFHRPYTAAEQKFILSRLQHYYRNFLKAVSKGRKEKKLTEDQVHALARGRVWTGRQAVKNGLADAEGGLLDAIAEARKRAGFKESRRVKLFVLPRVKKNLLTRVVELATSSGQVKGAATLLPPAALEALRGVPPVLLRARSGEALARMPFEIVP